MKVRAPGSRLDHEVRELLRNDPDLLAVAELIASLRPEDVDAASRPERRPRRRFSSAVRTLLSKARRRPSR